MPSVWIQRRTSRTGVRYHVKYRVGGREARAVHGGAFGTLREARARRDWIAGELAHMRVPDVRALTHVAAQAETRARTLAQVCEEFAHTRVDVGAAAHAHYRQTMRRLGALGRMEVSEIRPGHVQAWVNAQSELSPKTVAVYPGVIKQVLDFADLDRPNAARHRSVRVPRTVREVPEPPSQADFLALRSAMPTKWHAVMDLLEQTGLRVGELEGLRWADIDVRGARLRVRGTKTRAARRWVPLMPETLTLLEAMTPADARAPLAPVVDPALTPAGLGRAMLRASQVAGIAHATPHDLRHRYISLLVMAGVPLPLIGQVVGHSRASVTLDVYAHVLLAEPEARLCALRAGVMRSGATPVLPEQLAFRPENDESPAKSRASAEVEDSGLEPLTFALPARRSPS